MWYLIAKDYARVWGSIKFRSSLLHLADRAVCRCYWSRHVIGILSAEHSNSNCLHGEHSSKCLQRVIRGKWGMASGRTYGRGNLLRTPPT